MEQNQSTTPENYRTAEESPQHTSSSRNPQNYRGNFRGRGRSGYSDRIESNNQAFQQHYRAEQNQPTGPQSRYPPFGGYYSNNQGSSAGEPQPIQSVVSETSKWRDAPNQGAPRYRRGQQYLNQSNHFQSNPSTDYNNNDEDLVENLFDEEAWIKEPTIIKSSNNEQLADLSTVVNGNCLIDPTNREIIRPQGLHGAGLASQMLIDAPYFYTEPIPPAGPMGPVYNLTHFYSPMKPSKKYILNRVIKTLLNPRCTYHERFALEVYKQDACRALINEVKALGYTIPTTNSGKIDPDQYVIIKQLRLALLGSLSTFIRPLATHYFRVRDFMQRDLHISTRDLYLRTRGRNNKDEDKQKLIIEWLSAVVVEVTAAEEKLASARQEDGGKALNSFIDLMNILAIDLPLHEAVRRRLFVVEEVDNESEDDEEEEIAPSPTQKFASPVVYPQGTTRSVHSALMANGKTVSQAMKGWFGASLVLGPRTDRKARRDLMRARGELPPIDRETSNVSDNSASDSEQVADCEPRSQPELPINIHKKMMYFHTATIDPTQAAANPSIKLPQSKDKKISRDATSPQGAIGYLRRLRASEASASALRTGLLTFRELPEVLSYVSFNKKVKEAGIEELQTMVKQFDVRLGFLHVKEGAANELRVWRDNIPRIVSEVLSPRYTKTLNASFEDMEFSEANLGFQCNFSGNSAQTNDNELAISLLNLYRSVLEKPHTRTDLATLFWVTKCQLMLLTENEALIVKEDQRFVRISQMLAGFSDNYICKTYKVENCISVDDISKREKVLESELKYVSNPVHEVDGEAETISAKKQSKEREMAAGIRQSILSYLSFWIHCDLLNERLRKCGKPTVPFFYFVTQNTKYGSKNDPIKWAHVGELDGLLLDLSGKAPQLLNVFEIKANAADLTGAWKQRDRFLSTCWTAFCRKDGESFVPPLHQHWYTMHGTIPKIERVVTPGEPLVTPGEVGNVFSTSKQMTLKEIVIYPSVSGTIALPAFYQLIFPLFSFNVANLLLPRHLYNDSGEHCTDSTASMEHLKSIISVSNPSDVQTKSPPSPILADIYMRITSMWVFTTFVVVNKEGVPIIPTYRLVGMGPFRHILCNGAAVLYSGGRKNDCYETWEQANSEGGTLYNLRAAQERHNVDEGNVRTIGPWLREITQRSPKEAISKAYFDSSANSSFVFSSVFHAAIKLQRSKITNVILCPQELVSELSRNRTMTSLLLIPKFESVDE